MDSKQVAEVCSRIIDNIERVIVGKREVVERTMIALMVGGHVLFEDVPGVGKTMLGRAIAGSIGCKFRRIQFTPDLLPSDVTGVSIFNQKTGEFAFREGPVFAGILLADEVNRASPRTQAALLEAMEEGQVTVDGFSHPLPKPFLVIATDNPIEYEGVYPLPESQLDRFLLRLHVGYPTREAEESVVKQQLLEHPIHTLAPVATAEDVLGLQKQVRTCHVDEALYGYALDIVQKTRESDQLYLGASPRGTLALIRSAQALAALRGRDFVAPDEVKELAPSVLAHRVILRPEARMNGVAADQLIAEIIDEVPVPV
jgi:MoxR-like ATPase